MRNPVRRSAVAVLALALAAPVLAQADDLTITSTTTVNGKPGKTTMTYMTADRMRTSDAATDSIIDVKTGTMTVVDNGKKQYYVITQQDVQQAMAQLDQMLQQQQAQMANMPAFLRDKIAKATGGGDTDLTTSVKPDPAGNRKIAGYDTEHYVINVGSLHQDIWAAPAVTVPFNYADVMRLRSAMSAGPIMKKMQKMAESMATIKGFPLATELTVMGQDVKTEATEVSRGPIPASTFAVPTGYKLAESPLKQLAQKH
jgi:hypothetical protein